MNRRLHGDEDDCCQKPVNNYFHLTPKSGPLWGGGGGHLHPVPTTPPPMFSVHTAQAKILRGLQIFGKDVWAWSLQFQPLYSLIQYSTVQYSTVQYSTLQYSTVQYSTVQYSTVQYSTVQYSTVQYSTVQFSTVQYSTVQYSTVQVKPPAGLL